MVVWIGIKVMKVLVKELFKVVFWFFKLVFVKKVLVLLVNWIMGIVFGLVGLCCYCFYKLLGIWCNESLLFLVMLYGCG